MDGKSEPTCLDPVSSSKQDSNEQIDHAHFLVSDISSLYLNDRFSDVVLVVDEERFPAHRNILASRSDYFRALFNGDFKEFNESVVEIKEISVISFKILLRYIYTGRMNLNALEDNVVLELFSVAHLFSFSNLQLPLAKYLQNNGNEHNVCSLFAMARLYHYEELEYRSLLFLKYYALDALRSKDLLLLSAEAIQDLLNRDSVYANEIDIFRAVSQWIQENQNDLSPDTKIKVLSVVRYQLMTDEDLSEVRKSQLVGSDTISDAAQMRNTRPLEQLKYRVQLRYHVDINKPQYGFPVIDATDGGTMINFGLPMTINYIEMMLHNEYIGVFSYYVEVSMDGQDWARVIDHSNYNCRSIQRLWIYPRIVKYTRVHIVGNESTANVTFKFLKVTYNSDEMHSVNIVNGLTVPKYNVASRYMDAFVMKGNGSRSQSLLYKHCENSYIYTYHLLASGFIVIHFAQPYIIGSMRMRLWDHDDRVYSYTIEASVDNQNWEMVVNKSKELTRSWQMLQFTPRLMSYIRITGVHSSVGNDFRCIYLEAPAQVTLDSNVVEDDFAKTMYKENNKTTAEASAQPTAG
ncbi:BTB/POZ domain-containing protein 9-like [Adelges cooleyi]|uniref:BTB/POZ domain-containing protein 9-like n=1 Tax=Adelges cooleyi TaxID=133065 RepID=UPI00217FED94|nr:BTB/POZ domain-containing protein 9-like [Adelges cooleyi]